jgi:biopolymer transport protein TolQ
VVLGRILEAGLNEARKLTGNQAPVNPQATEWIIAGAQKPPAEEGPGRLAPELMPNVLSAMERAVSSETQNLEQRLGVLATATSVCPFLGLFGTVWGIMDSFIEIQSFGTANINVVAPGIAEALITTVGGLAVAIPAVMAYNYFARRLRRIIGIMDDFASEFASELRRGMYR